MLLTRVDVVARAVVKGGELEYRARKGAPVFSQGKTHGEILKRGEFGTGAYAGLRGEDTAGWSPRAMSTRTYCHHGFAWQLTLVVQCPRNCPNTHLQSRHKADPLRRSFTGSALGPTLSMHHKSTHMQSSRACHTAAELISTRGHTHAWAAYFTQSTCDKCGTHSLSM